MGEIQEKLKLLPDNPGVYIMLDREGIVIYVGKARVLKNRVRQYFHSTAKTEKVAAMVENIADFYYIITQTEIDALALENNLIKKYKPKYNILLKDDKGYPYLRIDLKEEYPKITLANRVAGDGAKYFGPYGSRGRSQQVIDSIRATFRLPNCGKKFPRDIGKDRPCLNFHMGTCAGWCRENKTAQEYRALILQAVQLLEGKHKTLCRELREKMEEAAENLEFERAAEYRDRLHAIELLSQKQTVTAGTRADTDVIGWYETEAKACFAVLHYVGGNLMDKDYEVLSKPDEPQEALSSLVKQYYLARGAAPKRVLLPFAMEDAAPFARLLLEKLEKTVRFLVPQRGDSKKLVELAVQNAKEEAERATTASERHSAAMLKLQSLLGLREYPMRMEAYDISNIAGTDIVASMTVFVDGKPKKKDYKRFKIENLDDQDDYASMQQVLCRRYCHYLDGDKGFEEKADVLLIDGGIVHAQVVKEALGTMGLDIPIFGMVKDDRHRTRALVTPEGEELGIQATPAIFALIGQIQEETHRFAITYHRQLRSKRLRGSTLDQIKGVGEKRRLALLKHFKSVAAIKAADMEELKKAVNAPTARAVYEYFHRGE